MSEVGRQTRPPYTGSVTAVLAVICFASFVITVISASVNIALPRIGAELGMDNIELGWVSTISLLASAVFLVPFGRLADMYGRKRMFLIGTGLFTAASLGMGFAPSGTFLIAMQGVQGVAGGMLFGTGPAILTSVLPPERRGRALGINTAAVYIGLSLGPFFGGLLTEHLGWRGLFFVNVPLGLAILGLTAVYMKWEFAGARGEKYDVPGSVLYGLSLLAIMYGFTVLPSIPGFVLVALGLGGIAGFFYYERRAREPVLRVSLFAGNPAFTFSNIAALLNYASTFAITFLMSLYLQYIKALTPAQAGLVLLAQPIMMAIVAPLSGRLSDRVEPRIPASIGMGLSAIGLGFFIPINDSTGLPYIVIVLVVIGTGFGLFSAPNMNAAMGSVEHRFLGVASATISTMRLLGQMLSMGVAMLVFSVVMGRVDIVPGNYPLLVQSIQVLFVIFAVLLAVGVVASMRRGNIRKKPGAPV